ncbi:MAG: hypothetical protein V1913_11810 [Fibrobacterota bacterium]
MKKWMSAAALLLALAGCSTGLKLLALRADVGRGGRIDRYAILALPPSAYTRLHTVPAVRDVNFAQVSQKALEDVAARKRTNWKAAYPAASAGADSAALRILAARKDDLKKLSGEEKAAVKKLADALETRYFFVLESASVKDVSSPQVPRSLVLGACLQLWDFQAGELVYRARETSRTVAYGDEDFRKRLDEALTDLFEGLISPLAKD